jgi:hypothetical protein
MWFVTKGCGFYSVPRDGRSVPIWMPRSKRGVSKRRSYGQLGGRFDARRNRSLRGRE